MIPVAYITHRLPGRTRLKILSRRGNQRYFERLAENLGALSGVREVTATARTGSVLVRHDAPLSEIAAFAAEHDLFTVGEDLNWRHTWAQQTSARLAGLDRRIKRLSEGHLDLRSAIVLAFLGLSVAQVLRGQVLPPASTLLWYAAQVLGIKGVLTDEQDRR